MTRSVLVIRELVVGSSADGVAICKGGGPGSSAGGASGGELVRAEGGTSSAAPVWSGVPRRPTRSPVTTRLPPAVTTTIRATGIRERCRRGRRSTPRREIADAGRPAVRNTAQSPATRFTIRRPIRFLLPAYPSTRDLSQSTLMRRGIPFDV